MALSDAAHPPPIKNLQRRAMGPVFQVSLVGALVLIVSALVGIQAPVVEAATFTVTKTADTNDGTCDGDCSLREAVLAANAAGGADAITVPAGTYVLTSGALGILDGVTITGAGSATTIIDGNAQDRVIDLAGVTIITVDITGVTARNGRAQAFGSGAGIHVNSSHTLNLTDVVVTGNHATGSSGGIFGNLGPVTLTNSVVNSNTADFSVGGINGSTLHIIDSTISGNSAAGGSGGGVSIGGVTGGPSSISGSTISGNVASGNGGGVLIGKDTTISDTVISGNTASKGGGIHSATINVTLTDVTITGNTATSIVGGGGISTQTQNLAITNATISGNMANSGPGGGIAYEFGSTTTTLTNSTVSGNLAAKDGGGIALIGSFSTLAVELESVTVTGNTADSDSSGTGDGGGIYRQADVGTLYFRNTIVAGNVDSGGQAPDCSGGASAELTSRGHNLVQNTAGCGIVGDTTGNITGQDPLLGPLQDNGGLTDTHALPPGSPAVDAGAGSCPATDQRGTDRPQGLGCDIGAYELVAAPPPPPVPGLSAWSLVALAGIMAAIVLRRMSSVRRTTQV